MSQGRNKDVVVSIGADVDEQSLESVEAQLDQWAEDVENDLEIDLKVHTDDANQGAERLETTIGRLAEDAEGFAGTLATVVATMTRLVTVIGAAAAAAKGVYDWVLNWQKEASGFNRELERTADLEERFEKARQERAKERTFEKSPERAQENLDREIENLEKLQKELNKAQMTKFEIEQAEIRGDEADDIKLLNANLTKYFEGIGATGRRKEQEEVIKQTQKQIDAQRELIKGIEKEKAAYEERLKQEQEKRDIAAQADLDAIRDKADKAQEKKEEKPRQIEHEGPTAEQRLSMLYRNADAQKRADDRLEANAKQVEKLRTKREEVAGRQQKRLGGFDRGLESFGARIEEAANADNDFEKKKLEEIAKLDSQILEQDGKRNTILKDLKTSIEKINRGMN